MQPWKPSWERLEANLKFSENLHEKNFSSGIWAITLKNSQKGV